MEIPENQEDAQEEAQDDAFDESKDLTLSPAVEISRDNKKGLKRKTSIFKYYSFKSTGTLIYFFFINT